MRDLPEGITERDVARALADGWDLAAWTLEYAPVGGGVGQAPGFAAAVTGELRQIAPVMPEVKVSALGTDAVVDGCLAAGAELAWAELTVSIPGPAAAEAR